MKRLIICFLMLVLQSSMILAANKFSENVFTTSEDTTYTIRSYGEIPIEKSPEVSHYLGNEVAQRWQVFLNLYTYSHKMSVGFSDCSTEILKPAIYNAVQKVNRGLKKKVSSGEISFDNACRLMIHILDCANVMQGGLTEDIERSLSHSKSLSEIITVFNRISIEVV